MTQAVGVGERITVQLPVSLKNMERDETLEEENSQ